jgi:hypothetical protein
MTSVEIVDFINGLRKEEAAAAGKAFPSPGHAKLEHSDFMKKVPEVLGGGAGNFSGTYLHPQNGQTYPCYVLPKREATLLAMSYSYAMQAKVWDHMTALENRLVALAVAPRALTRGQVAASILLLRSAAEDLKLAPSALLGGYQKLQEQIGVVGLLPSYAVDSPANSGSGSSETTKALAVLLKEFKVGMGPAAFNQLLQQKGFLKEEHRPSSKGGTKAFKVCANLEFGKNITSPKNPRESQPHWYVAKFPELLRLVLPPKDGAPQGELL